jgi:CheY-like chemotaxis protein
MKKKKIMVVDDEDDMRYVLRRFLEDENYEVMETKGGPQCFEMIKTEKPDLIILDILMPGMNGWDVCKVIKEHGEFPDVPVSMLSVLSDAADVRKSRDYALADVHISKPIDFDILSNAIKTLLKGQPKRPPPPPGKPKRPPQSGPDDFFTPYKFERSKPN